MIIILSPIIIPQVTSTYERRNTETYPINSVHYPLRLKALNVLDVLTNGTYERGYHGSQLHGYNLIIDNITNSLTTLRLKDIYERVLMRPMPADPSSELQDTEGYIRDEIDRYLRFFNDYTPLIINPITNSIGIYHPLVFYIDTLLDGSRGKQSKIFRTGGCCIYSLRFSSSEIREPRSFIVPHEMFHTFLDMKHADDGKPIREVEVSDLYRSRKIYSTEDSLNLYENRFNFNTPGSLSGDSYLMWLGQYDWSVIQSKGYVSRPPGISNTNIYIDGKDVKRGSPGPESWFKDIIVYKNVKSPKLTSLSPGNVYEYLVDVFAVAYENMWIYRRAVSYSGSSWGWTYFLPWDYGDYFYLWQDLWDLDRAFIKWIPGDVEFKYRSDKVRGPSFHPKMPDYPLRLIVRDLKYASIQLYGSNKTIVLKNTSKAHLILGMDVDVEIWGYESEGHCLLLPNTTIDNFSCTNEDNQTLLEWSRPHVNFSAFSQVLFPDVASCDELRWCAPPQAMQYFLPRSQSQSPSSVSNESSSLFEQSSSVSNESSSLFEQSSPFDSTTITKNGKSGQVIRASSYVEIGECVSFDDCPDSETHSYEALAYLTFWLLFQFPAFIQWSLVVGLVVMGCGLCIVIFICCNVVVVGLLCQFPAVLQCLFMGLSFVVGACTCCCLSLGVYKKVAHDYIKDLAADIYDHMALRNSQEKIPDTDIEEL
jgi:hypothetical protein